MLQNDGQVRSVRARIVGPHLQHALPRHEVARRVEKHAFRLQPVTAGAACLLLIMLHRLGHGRVQDKANVGPVDAHAERHGGDDDVAALLGEGVLGRSPFAALFAGVIGQHLQPMRL